MKIIIASLKGTLIFPYVGQDYDMQADLTTLPEHDKKLFFDFNINQLARLLIETVIADANDMNTIALVANRYAQLSNSPQQYEAEAEYLVLEVNMEPDICKWSMIIPYNTVTSDQEAIALVRNNYSSMYN